MRLENLERKIKQMRSAAELEKIKSNLKASEDLLKKKKLEAAQLKWVVDYFDHNQKLARKVRTLERGASNGEFIALFQRGISSLDANRGYYALIKAFVARNELCKDDDGTVIELSDEQIQKFRVVSQKMEELINQAQEDNAAQIVQKFLAEKKYDLVHPRTGAKYKSRALNFFIPDHRMIAEIREYEDGTKTVAWINAGKHAEQDPYNPGLVKILSEREVGDDEDLKDLVSRILMSSNSGDVSFIAARGEWSYKPGFPQVFGNCPTNSINILINYYLRDREDPELAASFRSFVENFKSDPLIEELDQKYGELFEKVEDLESDFRKEKERARKNGFDPEGDEIRAREAERRKKEKFDIPVRTNDAESVENLQLYLSKKEAEKSEIEKFEVSINAHKEKTTPPFYRGCGFRYELIKNYGSGGVSSTKITEIFSVGFSRFSRIPNEGTFMKKDEVKGLAGLFITEIITPDGRKIKISELFQPPKDQKDGEKELSKVLHGEGKISFKAINDRGEEVNFACERERESVFVTGECSDSKTSEYFKNKNYAGDFQTGVQYNPKIHGATLSEKTETIALDKKSPATVLFPRSSSSAFAISSQASRASG